MFKDVKLSEQSFSLILKNFQEKLSECDRELMEIHNKRESIELLIKELTHSNKDMPKVKQGSSPILNGASALFELEKSNFEYNSEFTWFKKALFGIHHHGGKATSRQIVDLVLEKEPQLGDDKVMSSISSILSTKTKKRILKRELNTEGGEFEYSLK